MRIGVREVEDVFLAPVSDDVVTNINMFRPLCGHIVCGHVYACLVILIEEDWFDDRKTKFFEERADPYDSIARVSDSPVLCGGSGLGRDAWLKLAAEIHQVPVYKDQVSTAAAPGIGARCKARVSYVRRGGSKSPITSCRIRG